jgi:hypothetical protein
MEWWELVSPSGIRFGVADTEDTRAGGWAGLEGHCWGVTARSITRVELVGGSPDDLPFNVHFDDDAVPNAWFHPDLVQYLDHAPGNRGDRWRRSISGHWQRVEQDSPR